MRVTKYLRDDQELILSFLDLFGGASTVLGSSKLARPGFFLFAYTFIHEYVEQIFFRKEELLLTALEDTGFPGEGGPIGSMRAEQKKSHESAELLVNAAKAWQAGDEDARAEVGWAASEYLSTLRQHMDRLKTLIFPLLDQNLNQDDERKIAEGINSIIFENNMTDDPEKYTKQVKTLKEELDDWK